MDHHVSDRPGGNGGPMLGLLGISFGCLANFYLLLPVVPQYAVVNGAAEVGAGVVTAVSMAAAAGTELVSTR